MIYKITPISKPRMTQRDKWKKRLPVLQYYAFKDKIRLHKVVLPESNALIIFGIPMPNSWSKGKRIEMDRKPHQQKPDVDNLLKALCDAVYDDDCRIWDVKVRKIWSVEGCIEIRPYHHDV